MTPYNRIKKNITNGLNRVPVGTAGGYIQLLDSPAGANVQIHLNEQNADGIPLKDYHAIEADGIEKIFVSADPVDGGSITLLQSNKKQFQLITPASDINVDEIGSYSDVALTALDKIMNPYNTPLLSYAETNSTSEITLTSKLLSCDKIRFILNISKTAVSGHMRIMALLDGVSVAKNMSFYSSYNQNGASIQFELQGVKGKTISFVGLSPHTTLTVGYTLEEYTLK